MSKTKIKKWPTSKLAEATAEYNPRRIDDEQMEQLKESIKRFGLSLPITLNTTTGRIVSGHQRLRAAQELKIKSVPVLEVELTEEQERLANIALNNIKGENDARLLVRVLDDIATTDELPPTGLNHEAIADIRAAAGADDPETRAKVKHFKVVVPQRDRATIQKALRHAKQNNDFSKSENANSNGNALAHIAEWYLTQE